MTATPVEAAPGLVHLSDKGAELDKEVERFEKAMIKNALKKADGVKSKAADLLGIKRTTLIEKMKRLGI